MDAKTQDAEEALRQAQIAKVGRLNAIVGQAQAPIAKIKELNGKIKQAVSCATSIKSIPGMLSSACSTMAVVGQNLQAGLKINGQSVGANTVASAQSIQNSISSEVSSATGIIKAYCSKKKSEAEKEKAKAEKLKSEYSRVLASYPSSLGPYGPPQPFPEIPKIEEVSI